MQPLTKAGLVLGLGLGGFMDGIVLHQILGWHHLICSTETCQAPTVEALKTQNTQDGFFHLATWVLTAVGVAMLFTARRDDAAVWTGRVLLGSMVAGWGVFNFVEGLVNHQLLAIHHVLPSHPQQLLFDLLFLASGVAMMGAGAMLVRMGQQHPRRRPHADSTAQ